MNDGAHLCCKIRPWGRWGGVCDSGNFGYSWWLYESMKVWKIWPWGIWGGVCWSIPRLMDDAAWWFWPSIQENQIFSLFQSEGGTPKRVKGGRYHHLPSQAPKICSTLQWSVTIMIFSYYEKRRLNIQRSKNRKHDAAKLTITSLKPCDKWVTRPP